MTASPSLSEGLSITEKSDISNFDLSDLVGYYERYPVENDYHEVNII